MRSWSKINQASAAVSNRRLVIHLLRESGPLSRRQLAQRSGLQSSTLTYITRELMANGVIRDCGKLSKAGAGKKQSLLEINPGLGWVVGIGLEHSSASLVFLNTQGEVIDRDRVSIREPWDMLAQTLRARVHSWVARHGEPEGALLGVGVGVPGIVDPHEGVVLHSTRFAIKSWPLAKVFSQTFEVPVVIDNDSKLATQAESRIGNAQNKRDFVYFLLNATEDETGYRLSSLGSSLFLNGMLHRGARFGSGEINTQIEGEPYGSIRAQDMLTISDPKGTLDERIQKLADHMVSSLVAICDLVDPAAVVLGGNLGICNEQMIQYIESRLNARIAHVPGRYIEVLSSRHMDHGVSLGAAITALDAALLHGSLPVAASVARQAVPVVSEN
mgnify:CR=1 FL=1